MNRIRWLAAGLAVMALLVAVPILFDFSARQVAIPQTLFRPVPEDFHFLDRHGNSLRRTPHEMGEFREGLDSLPPTVVGATLAAEDKRFFSHQGVDIPATARALATGTGGGSTITQQLIKNATGNEQRTLFAKVREILAARHLELEWSKEKILREYLNRIAYGNRQIGIARAADFYFGKSPGQLSHAEAAFLAGLPNAPSRLNPHRNFEEARLRQQTIINRMEGNGVLDQGEARRARREELRLLPPGRHWEAPHFVDFLLARMDHVSGTFQTTLDLPLQKEAERILAKRLGELEAQNVRHGALVILDNQTGDILALCGSPDYSNPDSGQVNGALAARSSGSAVKPFIYAIAFEMGDSGETLVEDSPTAFLTTTGLYRPVNYNRKHYGEVTYRRALGNSLNISAVKVLERIGGPQVLRKRLRECGISSLTRPAEHYGPGLAIGNAEVSLLELSNAYAMLARGGIHREVRWEKSSPVSEGLRRYTQASTELLTDILSDNNARSDIFGWFSPLRLPFPVAAKTGTSTDYRDNWCLGYTPEFTVGVWVGNFDGSAMQDVTGVTGAAPIFHDLMLELARRFGVTSFKTTVATKAPPRPGLALRIEWPQDGSRLFLDPDLPGGGATLLPRANIREGLQWESPTLAIQQNPYPAVTLTPGTHELTVRDSEGHTARIEFLVEKL